MGTRRHDGAPIIVALLPSVSDTHLAGLRADGVYYMFAGDDELDLRALLRVLGELGIERIRLGGGPTTTGAFLRDGLIDEVSLLLVPAFDGFSGSPTIVEDARSDEAEKLPLSSVRLLSSEVLDGGVVWLRYALNSASADAQG